MKKLKRFISIAVLLILIAGVPVGVYLVQHQQIFKGKAAEGTIVAFVDKNGNPVSQVSSVSELAGVKIFYQPSAGTGEPDHTRQVKTMLLQYLPPGGVLSVYPGAQITDPASFSKSSLLPAMSSGTRYHGGQQSLNFNLADEDIRTEYNPPPINTEDAMDLAGMFQKYDICNQARQKDLKFLIIFSASFGQYNPHHAWESYVTGTHGFPTNGAVLYGPQYCDNKTIVILSLVYDRGLPEALESYGHHLESVFRNFRPFEYSSWSDESAAQNPGFWGRGDSCGTDHNPPNARYEYDRSNPDAVSSDCQTWRPDGTGAKVSLGCATWGCTGDSWLVWWMQNMPGMNNGLVNSDGTRVPNWWVLIGDPDNCYNKAAFCSGLNNDTQPTYFRIANTEAELSTAHPFAWGPYATTGIIWPQPVSPGNGVKTAFVQFQIDGVWQASLSTSVTVNDGTRSILPSVNPSSSAAPGTRFRVANSLEELSQATDQSLDVSPKIIDWQLSEGSGQKTVYGQFFINGVWQTPISTSVILNSSTTSPSPSSSTSTYPTPVTYSTPYGTPFYSTPTSTYSTPASIYSTPYSTPYSASPQAHQVDIRFDLNSDGTINSVDISILFTEWRKGPRANLAKVDFNGDGVINSIDYALLRREIQ